MDYSIESETIIGSDLYGMSAELYNDLSLSIDGGNALVKALRELEAEAAVAVEGRVKDVLSELDSTPVNEFGFTTNSADIARIAYQVQFTDYFPMPRLMTESDSEISFGEALRSNSKGALGAAVRIVNLLVPAVNAYDKDTGNPLIDAVDKNLIKQVICTLTKKGLVGKLLPYVGNSDFLATDTYNLLRKNRVALGISAELFPLGK